MASFGLSLILALFGLSTANDGFEVSKSVSNALNRMLYENDECTSAWPNVTHCIDWWTDLDDNMRYCLSNSIPPYPVEPYCPFGVGQGYCMTGENHDDCQQFKGMECPAQPGAPATGDVPVAQIVLYGVTLNPDPTADNLPAPIHKNSAVKWYYTPEMNSNKRRLLQQDGSLGATIGVHISGQNIKGPNEAEGANIDQSNIPLICGGHVTPPLGLGPLYHFHKASTCLMDDMADIVYHERDNNSSHSDLVAYANDGFGIYGFYDLNGSKPIVDECNGHFGCLDDACSVVEYHYHAQNATWDGGKSFSPYWIGCLGPSKGVCNETVSPTASTPTCGTNDCGYQICVQPGTNEKSLNAYIDSFGKENWLDQFTVNPY